LFIFYQKVILAVAAMSNFFSKSFEDIKKYKPSIKESTIKNYLRNIRKISKELFNSDKPSIMYFMDHESVLDYIDRIANPFSRKTICTSILVLLGSNKEFSDEIKLKYSEYHAKLSLLHDKIYNENVKSNKEESNWITREEIYELIKKLKSKTNNKNLTPRQIVDTYQQHLVLNLYTQLPPIRNDYADVKIVQNSFDEKCIDTNYNYIVIDEKILVLCNYKTAKYYGTKKIPLPDPLMELIIEYQKIKKDLLGYSGDFLLINTTNKTQMNTNTLTKYLNKIFSPKKVSSTILRKVYLSEKYPITYSMSEMQADAAVMGHNIAIARQVYTKKLS
jgi:integrase